MTFIANIALAFLTTLNFFQSPKQSTIDKVPGTSTYQSPYQLFCSGIYSNAQLECAGLSPQVFELALTGYYNLHQQHKIDSGARVLGIIDFDVPSTQKRLWLIDLQAGKLLINCLVAHGEKSGFDTPEYFSNQPGSNASSLGFYRTASTYVGSHGVSLKLDGLDTGYNDNARVRNIVMHGAPYVCQNSINELGCLGRSQGCPAVPAELSHEIVELLKNGNTLFIHKSGIEYQSALLNEYTAARHAFGLDAVMTASR